MSSADACFRFCSHGAQEVFLLVLLLIDVTVVVGELFLEAQFPSWFANAGRRRGWILCSSTFTVDILERCAHNCTS